VSSNYSTNIINHVLVIKLENIISYISSVSSCKAIGRAGLNEVANFLSKICLSMI